VTRSVTRLKRVVSMRAGGTPRTSDRKFWAEDGGGTPWVAIADMSSGRAVVRTDRSVSTEGLESRRLPVGEPGTLLFSMYASVGALAQLAIRATWNQAILGMEPIDECSDLRFVRYWLEHLRPSLSAQSRSNTQDNLNAEQVANFPFPMLEFARQKAIADFLDAETARIDALIAKKSRLVELIEERRMSVMAAGVSGRLTPTGQRKISSLPWLDTLPEHWDEVGLTLVARLGSGHTPSRKRADWWIESECRIPWITTGEVARLRSDRVEYIEETREKISSVGLEHSAAERHSAGTVVLCRTASAGYSGIMRSDMATSQDFATWTCGALLRSRFLLLCLRAMRGDLLGRLAMGSTHKTIYMPDIRSLRIPSPPVEVQDEIVEVVWGQLERDGRVEDLLRRQIELLTERRQALITAAVTGELDVARSIAEEAS